MEAGLSQLEALQCATVRAAKSLGLENLGEIKQGYMADLLILDENPLDDIEHTLSINRVIKGGKVYEQGEILASIPSDDEAQSLMEQFLIEFQDGAFI